MQRSLKIIVVLFFLFLSTYLPAQVIQGQRETNLPWLGVYHYPFSLKYVENNYIFSGKPLQNKYKTCQELSPAYYINSLGFFCRQELKLDKYTPIAFRFRLGSFDYTKWLEKNQKP